MAKTAKFDIYETITNRIIAELEKGVIPWQKPWTGTKSGAYSRSTGKPYSLLNQMLLPPGEYLTYKQAQTEGGQVRKGEKGSMVVFWKQLPIKEKDENGNEVEKVIPFLKYYTVFEVSQCDGIERKYKEEERQEAIEPVKEAELLVQEYLYKNQPLYIKHTTGNRAFYDPAGDYINLPAVEQFCEVEEYYSTKFHEMIDSTGHNSRLNRISKTASFGNEEYSKEELVAEMGAAMLVNMLGLETNRSFRNSAAYIQSWLKALKDNKRLVVSAAGKAQKAVEYITGEAK